MRILMVSEDLPGEQLGGLGQHVVTLANCLLRAGHQVEILGRNDRAPADYAAQIGFEGRFLPGFSMRRPGWKERQMGVFNPFKRPHFARRIARAIAAHTLRAGAGGRGGDARNAATASATASATARTTASAFDVVHYHGHLPMTGLFVDPGLNFVQTRHDQGSECLTHLRFRDGAICERLVPGQCAACIRPQAGPLRQTVSALAVNAYRDQAARAFGRHKTVFVSDFLRRRFLRAVPGADLSRSRVIHNFIDYRRLKAVLDDVCGSVCDAGCNTGCNTGCDTVCNPVCNTVSADLADAVPDCLSHHVRHPAAPDPHGAALAALPVTVLLAGRIDTGKGFAEFLAAAAWRLPPHVRVLVAGDGPQQAALARRHGGPQVRFLGWQAYPQVLALAARAQLCVVPSLCEEACSTAVLEALALGRPCIALARGGTPELAQYARYPGQLGLAASMDELVALALQRLAAPAPRAPPAPSFGADVACLLPQLLELYAEPADFLDRHLHP